MPLVTVTCSEKYYPYDVDVAGEAINEDPDMEFAAMLQNLPKRIGGLVEEELGLPGVRRRTMLRTRVTVEEAHPQERIGLERSDVDLWFEIQFDEPYPGKERGEAMRERFSKMLPGYLEQCGGSNVRCGFHLSWVPGHGCLMNASGKPELRW